MKKMIYRGIVTTGIITMMFAFGGCTNKENTKSETADLESKETTAATESKAEAGEATVIQVALDENTAPYTYADENGNLAGYDYEALKAIDEKIPEYTFEYNLLDYDASAVGVKTGKYQISAACKFGTPERAEVYLLSEPYDYYITKLAVKEDSSINSLEDMDGLTLAPIPSSNGLYMVLNDFKEAHPEITINCDSTGTNPSSSDVLNGVVTGRWDAALRSEEEFMSVLEQEDLPIKITDPVATTGTVLLINKDCPDLKEKCDEAIKTLTEDGTFSELSKKWFGIDVFEVHDSLAE